MTNWESHASDTPELLTGNALAYFILSRVWLAINAHPDWTSRMDSRRLIEPIKTDFYCKLTKREQEQIYRVVDHLRTMEVL